jgi:hypothetical protein
MDTYFCYQARKRYWQAAHAGGAFASNSAPVSQPMVRPTQVANRRTPIQKGEKREVNRTGSIFYGSLNRNYLVRDPHII